MVITRKSIPRRAFLRGTGAALALPMLGAMTPAFALEAKRPVVIDVVTDIEALAPLAVA